MSTQKVSSGHDTHRDMCFDHLSTLPQEPFVLRSLWQSQNGSFVITTTKIRFSVD
jgi:hypothetical protein